MSENVKNKDAEPVDHKDESLESGLEDTFPGSDPVSANQPGSKTDTQDDKK